MTDAARLVLCVTTEKAAMLVANETFIPIGGARWTAWRPPSSARTAWWGRFGFGGGMHIVKVRFTPRTLVVSTWISLLTALIFVGAAAMTGAVEKRRAHAYRNDRPSAAAR